VGIFLEGEVSTYASRFKPSSLQKLEDEFLAGLYKLQPDPAQKPPMPKQ
jgi:hypothetical protein